MPAIASEQAMSHCDPRDSEPVTLITIKGKKQTIMTSFEAWYELEDVSTRPLLIVMVKQKGAPVLSKLLTESMAKGP
jgi:hypothetical protein